ncbi:MAG: OmpP1/FadL family transporter, partial [Chitinophagaceae bacterium]
AQEPADALRFSWTVPSGTARQQAIGGSMTSLGGDITATFINPAGLGFYKTGDFAISPFYKFTNNKATYLNRTEKEKDQRFSLGTSGFVFGTGGFGRSIENVSYSIAYNRSADFNNILLYRGANNQSSYSQKFVEELNNSGRRDSTVTYEFPFGSSLAFNTYWIDPEYNSAGKVTGFKTKLPAGSTLLQQHEIENRGGVNEFALGAAVNFKNKLMLGGSLAIPMLRYERDATFSEADATENTSNSFNYASVTENLVTKGIGFTIRAGLIFKPQEFWRIGLAIHSPTFYNLTDNYEASITTDTEDPSLGVLTDYSIDYTNGQPSEFKYVLITPYRVMGSVSYVLREIQDVTKQKGFITADVEYVNYKASSFKQDEEVDNDPSTEEYLQSLNRAIDNAYKGAFNVKLGGELKFTTIMVRAGAAYYGNPYKNINGEKGNKLNLSGGLGYRNKGLFVDLTYVHAMNKDVHFPYRLQYSSYSGANIKSTAGSLLMTVGFKF